MAEPTIQRTPRVRAKVVEPVIEPAATVSAATAIPVVPIAEGGGAVAEAYIEKEIRAARTSLRINLVVGTIVVIGVCLWLGRITMVFASNLEPAQAATIAQGMIAQRLDDNIPELRRYIKEQVPLVIGKVPDYAKEQIPKYRHDLENKLNRDIANYAQQTAPELGKRLDTFLVANKDSVHTLLVNSQDPSSTAVLGGNMKQMFKDYLGSAQIGGETLQTKINATLVDLSAIDARVKRLADNKGLTENEQRSRRAIAILLRSVDENPQLKQASEVLQSIDVKPVPGVLQWKNPDEAVFTEPGKPPVTFVRKNGAINVKPPASSAVPPTKAPSHPVATG